MKNNDIVILENVTKKYIMYNDANQKIKDFMFGKYEGTDFYALKGVSFTAQKGDSIGLLGMNGSGKSTLANIIAGISQPTSGAMKIFGEASLISVGAGLNGQLTGVENIEMKGLMLGLSIKEINNIKEDIIDFADIGDFVYQPVKTYSSGMKARLGFGIAVNIDPDILIIDEALSVGDPTFTQKCLNKINEFRDKGKTMFFVSHSISQVKQFCNKVLWLEQGMLRAYGESVDICPLYDRFIKEFNAMTEQERIDYKKQF
ncbi:MAG: teichoic acids export ABC transporter ATP-binding subunit TagH [Clostridia bacterium]